MHFAFGTALHGLPHECSSASIVQAAGGASRLCTLQDICWQAVSYSAAASYDCNSATEWQDVPFYGLDVGMAYIVLQFKDIV